MPLNLKDRVAKSNKKNNKRLGKLTFIYLFLIELKSLNSKFKR